jgi:hypothetical protein
VSKSPIRKLRCGGINGCDFVRLRPCRSLQKGPKKISNFTKLLKFHAKPGKAAKNNREKQGWLAGAEAGKAGKQQAIETGPPRRDPSLPPGKTKDEAKDEAVIVCLGPGVAAFPRKRARSRDMPRQTPSKNPARYPAGLPAHFPKITLYSMSRDSCKANSYSKTSVRKIFTER